MAAQVIPLNDDLDRRMAMALTTTRIKRERRDAVILAMRQIALMTDDEIKAAFAHAEIVE